VANRKLNNILGHAKDRVAFFAHVMPPMSETRFRNPEQRSRVIAVEMRMIEERLGRAEKMN
jgi:hypothetical protein